MGAREGTVQHPDRVKTAFMNRTVSAHVQFSEPHGYDTCAIINANDGKRKEVRDEGESDSESESGSKYDANSRVSKFCFCFVSFHFAFLVPYTRPCPELEPNTVDTPRFEGTAAKLF